MSNNISNIRRSIGNTFSAATAVVAVSTEVIADGSGLLSNSISATPAVLKALLKTPFEAAKGYLMEAEGLSAEQAETVAFHYLEQDMAVTIQQGGEGAGKLVAKLFSELAEEDDTVDNKKVA